MLDARVNHDAMTRKSSTRVAKSTGCWPLLAMHQWAVATKPTRWPQVEERFLAAMWEFDQEFAAGRADQRDNQNGKGGALRGLIALLLENCSDKKLTGRSAVQGLIFPKHNLSTTYPKTGTVEILVQTKTAGMPRPGRNPTNRSKGKRGSAGLDEWIKEAGLKTIDLKAEWARNAGQGGGPTSDLVTWLRKSKPLSFLFLAIRVVDEKDLERTVFFANAANQMMDGVGLVAYETNLPGNAYQACKVPPHLELDRVLSRVCTALRNLP